MEQGGIQMSFIVVPASCMPGSCAPLALWISAPSSVTAVVSAMEATVRQEALIWQRRRHGLASAAAQHASRSGSASASAGRVKQCPCRPAGAAWWLSPL